MITVSTNMSFYLSDTIKIQAYHIWPKYAYQNMKSEHEGMSGL